MKLNYAPESNTIFIEETESQPELYTIAFQTMNDINKSAIESLATDLKNNDYHPLDRNDTPGFLKVLVHQLSSDSRFIESEIPGDWKDNCRIMVYMNPVYIMRKRLDGTLKAIEQIIENVNETGYVPEPIREIVSGGKVELPDEQVESIEEQLAAVGGESIDILLSKEANKEQLEIAKRIERYNAVLVQGPPGTGKTHTIANLMGHFLAQGKSILVTSQTPKALNVLKDKISPGLRNLCVSVLEDSNVDMERSIDGITDYMSHITSHEIKRDMDLLEQERRQIIDDLANVRRKIFRIINQECNCIVYNGEELSPSKAAAFVLSHAEELSYIPGKVSLDHPLPMSYGEFVDLYRSNDLVSYEDELELIKEIPNPEEILSPTEFEKLQEVIISTKNALSKLNNVSPWTFSYEGNNDRITFTKGDRSFSIAYPDLKQISELKTFAGSFEKFEPWMKGAAVDGKNGGAYSKRWELLIDQIKATCEYAESVMVEQFGVTINFLRENDISSYKASLCRLKELFEQKGKISKLTLMFNKNVLPVLEEIAVNGHAIQSAEECDLVLHTVELREKRTQCKVYWDELLATYGVPSFYDLDVRDPERIANNWISDIQKYLDWYKNAYSGLIERLDTVLIPVDVLFDINNLDSDLAATEKILFAVSMELPSICEACELVIELNRCQTTIDSIIDKLQEKHRIESVSCSNIVKAIEAGDVNDYMDKYSELGQMFGKYELQRKRQDLLLRLEAIAPQWAISVKNREGIHGANTVPDNIESAWKWKQLSGIIEDLIKEPFSELQSDSIRLCKAYRDTTARYAEKSAWYHLLRKTEGDIDIRQALQGWKQTVKRIGKGTGKNAPALKAKARVLMSQCQEAVPSWIMPINRALESLNPKDNRFDVIIIDEASQSDISSLAILYMGKKLIIVGDDKQVSPMAVGIEINTMNSLQQMYITDKIPNAHLYDAKTSIYDIAKTTFQPLMLREHFRCVPEIIGFSNMLSYDYKIKPLRDGSKNILLPAVVNYRVADGQRLNNKTNPNEAKSIVALMKACMEQPEYKGKTFGVISLLGDEQVRTIQRIIEENVDHKDIIDRKILCGNASHFQGDERDVVFLSLVDSSNLEGPIRLQGFGPDDAYRKRYNVAASRARDQLWVVDSLDSTVDLKPGDIRKMLIDYSLNPNSHELRDAEIEEKADSPFEISVAKTLADRGFHLVQQWKVGAYRIDMVAVDGNKKVAIECDGERYHNGEAKVREDMERQTILERLGWRFIRIRGSEYYRDPESTMARVIEELTNYGIMPCSLESQIEEMGTTSDLLERVKARAAEILPEFHGDAYIDMETIAVALNPKSIATNVKKDTREKEDLLLYNQDLHLKNNELSKVSKTSGYTKKPIHEEKPTQYRLPGLDDSDQNDIDIITLLNQLGVSFIDRRDNNGALWILGGMELKDVVERCKKIGVKFSYKEDGGRATKGKAGWWAK